MLVANDVIASFTISRVLFVVERLRTRRSALFARDVSRDVFGEDVADVMRLPEVLSRPGSRHSPDRPICERLSGELRPLDGALPLLPLPGLENRGEVVEERAAWMNLSRFLSGL